jgi:hypothetical protein
MAGQRWRQAMNDVREADAVETQDRRQREPGLIDGHDDLNWSLYEMVRMQVSRVDREGWLDGGRRLDQEDRA